MTGDEVGAAEAGEDDRDEDPEADHAHDQAGPLGHAQVELAPPRHLRRVARLRKIKDYAQNGDSTS